MTFAAKSPITQEGSPISDRTFIYGRPSPAADLRVFCLPYAGKGASVYRGWWEDSDRRIEFVPVQFPGRENRFRESLIYDLRELVESLAADIAPYTGHAYALFGHSMGATIAFELAHRLFELTRRWPRHLVVAGSAAPHRLQTVSPGRRRTDKELMTELRRLGGTPQQALDDDKLLAFSLPMLRADWTIVDGYRYRPIAALDVPITVLGSTGDPDVATDELRQWDRHTNAETRVHVFPGDHFFVDRFQAEIRDLLVSELAVEPEDSADEVPAHDDSLAIVLEASGRRALGDIDTNAWRAALHNLDAAALTAMTRAVTGDGEGTPVDGLAERLRVAPRHRWLLDRWVDSLLAEGRVVRRDGALVATSEAEPPDDNQVPRACAILGYGDSLRNFFLRCNGNLSRLLRDQLTVQEMLFEGGGFKIAESAYRDNPMNRYLNAALCAAVVHHVRNRAGTGPVRVLELGAGVGASTCDLLPALAATGVDLRYVFSDVSPVFLKAARERFADYPFIEFELIDINNGSWPSSAKPADVVLSANVLHNAHDVRAMLARLRRMIAGDGMLAFIESSREHYQLMASMQFMLSGRDSRSRPGSADFRAEENRICLTHAEWHEQLRLAAFTPAVTLPNRERDPAAVLEQYLYVATPTRGGGTDIGGVQFK